MRILIMGKNGQVGWELQRTLACLGEVIALDRQTMDLAKPESVKATIREIKPNLIVNAAAYTAVDKAESEPELAMAVNGIAPGIMAEEAKRLGALLVYYSTDYVFDGTKTSPYTEEDLPNPLNVYGRTKLVGEQAIQAVGGAHLIFRTSWVYGNRGKNFLLSVLRLASERDELRIVDDQVGAPTWSRIIAETTALALASCLGGMPNRVSESELSGVYHLTAGGKTSWFGFAKAILHRSQLSTSRKLTPIPSSDYPLPAKRPANSVLSNSKLLQVFHLNNPDWDVGLSLCLQQAA
jgi:dTDP-4-dehydrorhamnose reductase